LEEEVEEGETLGETEIETSAGETEIGIGEALTDLAAEMTETGATAAGLPIEIEAAALVLVVVGVGELGRESQIVLQTHGILEDLHQDEAWMTDLQLAVQSGEGEGREMIDEEVHRRSLSGGLLSLTPRLEHPLPSPNLPPHQRQIQHLSPQKRKTAVGQRSKKLEGVNKYIALPVKLYNRLSFFTFSYTTSNSIMMLPYISNYIKTFSEILYLWAFFSNW